MILFKTPASREYADYVPAPTLTDLFEECIRIDKDNQLFTVIHSGRVIFIFFPSCKEFDFLDTQNKKIDTEKNKDDVYGIFYAAQQAWAGIYQKIITQLNLGIPVKIVIAGYYYGGILAQFCYEMVRKMFPQIKRSIFGIGFECPRTFKRFEKYVTANVWKNFLNIYNNRSVLSKWPTKRNFVIHGQTYRIKDSLYPHSYKSDSLPESIVKSLSKCEINIVWEDFIRGKYILKHKRELMEEFKKYED